MSSDTKLPEPPERIVVHDPQHGAMRTIYATDNPETLTFGRMPLDVCYVRADSGVSPTDAEFEYQTLPDGTKAPVCPECKHAGDLNEWGFCQTESYHRDFENWLPCRHKCNVPGPQVSPGFADAVQCVEKLRDEWQRRRKTEYHGDPHSPSVDYLCFADYVKAANEILAALKALTQPAVAPNGVLELLNAAMLHPESAEGYIRQVIEMLALQPAVAEREALRVVSQKLEEMRVCPNGMCMHCIDLLLEAQEALASTPPAPQLDALAERINTNVARMEESQKVDPSIKDLTFSTPLATPEADEF